MAASAEVAHVADDGEALDERDGDFRVEIGLKPRANDAVRLGGEIEQAHGKYV